jgi:hypothetical protein
VAEFEKLVAHAQICEVQYLRATKKFIKCMYVQHIQGLCQFRFSTGDHALSLEAPATCISARILRSSCKQTAVRSWRGVKCNHQEAGG